MDSRGQICYVASISDLLDFRKSNRPPASVLQNFAVTEVNELRIAMKNNEIDVLAINESRMDNSIAPEMVTVHGYNWVSKDRNRFGGGVGFYVRNTINFCLRRDLNVDDIEILTIEIIKNRVKPFLITTWYRPPSDTINILYKFENCLKLIDNEDKESIILGDIN